MLGFSKSRPLVLILLGGMFVFLAVVFPRMFPARAKTKPADLPAQIAGLSKATSTTGAAAIEIFTRLHGKDIDVQAGANASYGTRQQVTLWIAEASSAEEASRLVQTMREKIAMGTSPFQPTGTISNGDRAVYALDGMGQEHYYFTSGARVIWLASDPEIADRALEFILTYYP